MIVDTNTEGSKTFYKYKQGYFYDRRSTDQSSKYWQMVTLRDQAGEEYSHTGFYAPSIKGYLHSIEMKEVEHEGKKFTTLELDIDGTEIVQFSGNSRTAATVIQSLASLDFSKPVQLIAWQKDGWDKISIKQDGEHVENKYNVYNEETSSFEYLNGYPPRPDKSASERDKVNYKLDEKDFLLGVVKEIQDLIPKEKKVYANEVNEAKEEASLDDIAEANAANDVAHNAAVESGSSPSDDYDLY